MLCSKPVQCRFVGSIMLSCLLLVGPSVSAFEVGFYNPKGINPAFASNVSFAMIEVIHEEQVLQALADARDADMSVTLNIGPVITESIPSKLLNLRYRDAQGTLRTKRFTPTPAHKIKRFLPDDRVLRIADRLTLAIKEYPDVIDTVFLIDEPYLKGVPPHEIDRVAELIRSRLKVRGIDQMKFGVVFASLTYDSHFAEMLDQQAAVYAAQADDRFDENQQKWSTRVLSLFGREPSWIEGFAQQRLVTYDQAGNLYTEGGLPKAIDVIGFNFYVSTLLLDDMYAKTPDWFAQTQSIEACDGFKAMEVADIREALSFFGGSSGGATDGDADRELLDQLFACRISAVGASLEAQMQEANIRYEVIMIGESSSNGLMRFTDDRGLADQQNMQRIEKRVLDEVQRYLRAQQILGIPELQKIAFFTFDPVHDYSIQQSIVGARDMPRVLKTIFQHQEHSGPSQ